MNNHRYTQIQRSVRVGRSDKHPDCWWLGNKKLDCRLQSHFPPIADNWSRGLLSPSSANLQHRRNYTCLSSHRRLLLKGENWVGDCISPSSPSTEKRKLQKTITEGSFQDNMEGFWGSITLPGTGEPRGQVNSSDKLPHFACDNSTSFHVQNHCDICVRISKKTWMSKRFILHQTFLKKPFANMCSLYQLERSRVHSGKRFPLLFNKES